MEWVPWDALTKIGPWGLVTLCVLLIFSGQLVPGREMKYWRQAFFSEQKMRQDMEVSGQLQRTMLSSIPIPPEVKP